jgi:hypothetical protein
MAVHCVRLPGSDDSDSSAGDLAPPPARHVAPQRHAPAEAAPAGDANPFEVADDPPAGAPAPDYGALGLPALSFASDPFLSPVAEIRAVVRRHRVWVAGVKGLKFSLAVAGAVVLVAKRRRDVREESFHISRSSDYSLDSPDAAGLVVRQRGTPDFTVLSARERQSDGAREALAGLRLLPRRAAVVGSGVWLPPGADSIFAADLTGANACALEAAQREFPRASVKNAAFARPGDAEPAFVAEKQADGTLAVTVRDPLCVLQAFGLAIALFAQ